MADPGRGLRIALIGIVPRERLPLHGYYAYLVLKNGVPVSYGAGWQIFGVLEAAVNVFESFRRGESAFIVSQVLRAYRQAFGMRRIVVDPYQIGRDNPEALASGAFYFYRRLGFRSLDPGVERLARAEDATIRARPGYRSPRAVLRQLASSEIGLSLGGRAVEQGSGLTASRLGALVTRHVARQFGGDRPAAVRRATRQVASALGVRDWARWSADERRGFAQLAPVIALIPDLARWPAADRRRLAAAMRAKGGASEARYVRRLDGIPRLRRSLEMLVGMAGDPVGGGASPASAHGAAAEGIDCRSLTATRSGPRSHVKESRPSGSKWSAVMTSPSHAPGAQSRSMRVTSRPEKTWRTTSARSSAAASSQRRTSTASTDRRGPESRRRLASKK